MLFNSIDFAIFLPIVFALYWFAFGKSRRGQNILLLVASYLFYGWWDWRFLGLILFSTAPLLISIKAMRALGLPSILADMTLLTFRYLFEIGNYLHQMETALRLRGFQARRFSRRGVNTLAWLSGSILVRSYERSEWIYKAMIMRGYGRDTKMTQGGFQSSTLDILAFAGLVLLAIGFVVVQVII